MTPSYTPTPSVGYTAPIAPSAPAIFTPGPEALAASNQVYATLKESLATGGVTGLISDYAKEVAKISTYPVGTSFAIAVPTASAAELAGALGVSPTVFEVKHFYQYYAIMADGSRNFIGTGSSATYSGPNIGGAVRIESVYV